MAGRRMPYIPVTGPRSVKIHARYGICMHYPSQRINVPCQAIDRQGHRPDHGTGQRRCHVNRYGFSIRTRHGQRVDNILIMAATQVDAERRLRQMYHHCQTRGRSMSVDYAGLADKWIIENGGQSIGTKFTGTVTEKAMADGRAKVTVVLNTKKALVWVEDSPDFSGPLLFGNKAPEVLAGARANTCSSSFRVTFINTAPGAPLPDLIQLAVVPEPGQEILSIAANCNAKGQLHAAYGVPEGTPGRAISRQAARVIDGSLTFTTENVILKVLQ